VAVLLHFGSEGLEVWQWAFLCDRRGRNSTATGLVIRCYQVE
jgi:hypothetical protein